MRITLDKWAYKPEKAHKLDAGYDLRASKGYMIHPGRCRALETGVHIELPENTVGYIKNRSSMFLRQLVTDGTIDPGYTGPIKVMMHNNGPETALIKRGDKIAQLVLHPILSPELQLVDKLDDTERGAGGFGSTGR